MAPQWKTIQHRFFFREREKGFFSKAVDHLTVKTVLKLASIAPKMLGMPRP